MLFCKSTELARKISSEREAVGRCTENTDIEKERQLNMALADDILPVDALTCILGLCTLDEIFSVATSCRTLFVASKSDKLEPLYRRRLMCIAADVFFSARAQNIPLMCTTWREALLRVWKINRLQWGSVTPGDKAVLSSVQKSRSTYSIMLELGGKRFLRLGGHYFFSVHSLSVDEIQLDPQSRGGLIAPTWKRIRPVGLPPSPLRFFSLTSMRWSPSSDIVKSPWVCMIGGSETSYPYIERNDIYCLMPLTNPANGSSTWRWIRPTVMGSPPQPRRGHSATFIGGKYGRVVLWAGARASPIANLNDVHILDTVIDTSEMHIRELASLEPSVMPKTFSLCMQWSVIKVRGTPPPGRYGHYDFLKEKRQDGSAQILYFGGSQFSGQLGMYDVACLDIESIDSTDGEISMTWSSAKTVGDSPALRRGHSTIVVGHNLIVFGGVVEGRASSSDNDAETLTETPLEGSNSIRVLDLQKLRWFQPEISGESPPNRCGHAMALWGTMFVISGGYLPGRQSIRETRLQKADAVRLFIGHRPDAPAASQGDVESGAADDSTEKNKC